MQIIADFFVDPLILPVYLYVAAYGFVWFFAFVFARLLMNRTGIERATTLAWGIALGAHIFGGAVLSIWICLRAIPRLAEWWYVPIYLALYVLILIVDICLLVSLSTQGATGTRSNVSSQETRVENPNPKKR